MIQLEQAMREVGLRPEVLVGERQIDFASDDLRIIVELKRGQGGVRDLHAVMLQLAQSAHAARARQAILLLLGTRMSSAGLLDAWANVLKVLHPKVAETLCLVAVLDDGVITVPEGDRFLADLGARVKSSVSERTAEPRVDRQFEVMRVLLSRWLLRRGPVTIRQLQEQTGLSHPTVSKGLAALEGAVERRRDRSVALRSFPSEVWARLVALAPKVRQTLAYIDASGRMADAEKVLDRARRAKPPEVAVGGVAGARHWDRALDLHGLPRLDLTVHAPAGAMDASFVERLDPALVPAPRGAPPVLVLHGLHRAESFFTREASSSLPWADPVEVLLDLHELRLVDQADALVRALRGAS